MSRAHEESTKKNKAVDELCKQAGFAQLVFERRAEQMAEEGLKLKSISIRLPTEDSPDYMVTIRADGESDAVVGFHGGLTLFEAVRGCLERLYNRNMKWRRDEYA